MHVLAVLLSVVSARSTEDPFARYFSRVEPRAPVQGSTSARYFADLHEVPARSPSPPAPPDVDSADASQPPVSMLAELPKTGLWAPRAESPATKPSGHVSASRLWQKQALPSGRGPIAGAEALWTGRPPVQGAWGGRAVEQPEQATAPSFSGAPSPELAPFAMSVPQPPAQAADAVTDVPAPLLKPVAAPAPSPALPAPGAVPVPSPAAAGALWRGEPPQAGLWQQQAKPPKVPSKPTDLTVDPGWLAFPRGEQPKGALLAEKQGNLRGAAAVPGDAVAEAPSTAALPALSADRVQPATSPADDPAEDQDGMLNVAPPGPAAAPMAVAAPPRAYNASQYSVLADERVPLSHRARNLDRGESILKRLSAITQKLHEMRHGDKEELAPAPLVSPVHVDAVLPSPAVVAAQVPNLGSSSPLAPPALPGATNFLPPAPPVHPPKENVSAPLPRSLLRHDLWDAHAFPTAAPTPAPVAPSPLLPPPVSVEEVKVAVESAAAAKKASAEGSGNNATAKEPRNTSDATTQTAPVNSAKVKSADPTAEAAKAPSAQAAVARVQQFHRQQSDATDQLAAALTGTSRDARVESLFKPRAPAAPTAAKPPAPPSPPHTPGPQPRAPAALAAAGPMGNEEASVESQLAAAENIQAGDADDDWLEAIEGVASG